MAKNRKGDGPAQRAPQVPRTVLNFIEEEQFTKAAGRRTLAVVAAFGLAAILAIAGAGFVFSTHADQARVESQAAGEEVVRNRSEISAAIRSVSQGEIKPGADLPGHLAARQKELGAALSVDTDVATLVKLIEDATPPAISISTLELTGAVNDSTAAPDEAKPEKPAAGSGSAAKTAARTVTLTATAPDYQAALQWQGDLQKAGVFATVGVTPASSSDGQILLNAVMTINDGALQSRRAASRPSTDGTGSPGTAPSPTPTPSDMPLPPAPTTEEP
jgi:hypothetical protein